MDAAGQPLVGVAGVLRRGDRFEGVEVLVDHGLDFGSVAALSESISKSACAFPVIPTPGESGPVPSRDAHLRRRRLTLQLECLGRTLPFSLRRERLAGASVSGPAPLRDMRRIQALPTQQRATLGRAQRQRVILRKDPGLVLCRELSSRRPGPRVLRTHTHIMGASQQRCIRHGHRSTCSSLAQ